MASKTIAVVIFTCLTAWTGENSGVNNGMSESDEFDICVGEGSTPMKRHCDSAIGREKFDPQKTIDAAKVAKKLPAPLLTKNAMRKGDS